MALTQRFKHYGLGVVPGAGNCPACGFGVVPGAGNCVGFGGVAPGFGVEAGDGAGAVPLGGSPGLEGAAGAGVAGFGVAALFVLLALFDDPRPHPSPHDARTSTDMIITERKMYLFIRLVPLERS